MGRRLTLVPKKGGPFCLSSLAVVNLNFEKEDAHLVSPSYRHFVATIRHPDEHITSINPVLFPGQTDGRTEEEMVPRITMEWESLKCY